MFSPNIRVRCHAVRALLPRFGSCWLLLLSSFTSLAAERINHEGRSLGALPVVKEPLLFNTPEADAVVSAMQIMPKDSPWNEDVSRRPVLASSDAMIAQIIVDLAPNRRTLRPFYEMNYVLVPDTQPVVPIQFTKYAEQSDLDGGKTGTGLYPIPPNMPVETWPRGTGAQTLAEWQEDTKGKGGDRHSIIVQPGKGFIWETWQAKRVGTAWQASNGAKFNLNSNALRPAGWTSADAAELWSACDLSPLWLVAKRRWPSLLRRLIWLRLCLTVPARLRRNPKRR